MSKLHVSGTPADAAHGAVPSALPETPILTSCDDIPTNTEQLYDLFVLQFGHDDAIQGNMTRELVNIRPCYGKLVACATKCKMEISRMEMDEGPGYRCYGCVTVATAVTADVVIKCLQWQAEMFSRLKYDPRGPVDISKYTEARAAKRAFEYRFFVVGAILSDLYKEKLVQLPKDFWDKLETRLIFMMDLSIMTGEPETIALNESQAVLTPAPMHPDPLGLARQPRPKEQHQNLRMYFLQARLNNLPPSRCFRAEERSAFDSIGSAASGSDIPITSGIEISEVDETPF